MTRAFTCRQSKEIYIPYNEWSRERLLSGKKTATTRRKKYGNVGDTFKVDGITYKIIDVKKLILSFIAYYLYDHEGAKDTEEFIKVWNDIHPKGFTEMMFEKFWYHSFEKINNDDDLTQEGFDKRHSRP